MKKFDQDVESLEQQLIAMWDLTETMVTMATGAFYGSVRDVAAGVLEHEKHLDQMQLDIDHEAIRILTIYSPVASDLRYVLSISHLTNSLERIGDQAVNLCEDLELMRAHADSMPTGKLRQMSKVVTAMVHDSVASFVARDVATAEQTLAIDDRVDALNDEIFRELLSDEFVRGVIANPDDMAGALAQLLIARSLERMADQACNICEQVVFVVSGDDIRHGDLDSQESKS